MGFLWILSACAPMGQFNVSAVALDDSITPQMKWDDPDHPERRKWSHYLLQAVANLQPGLDLENPADIKEFCPDYERRDRVQRQEFWAYLVSAMAQYESNFDSDASLDQGILDRRGRPVIARGLLQITLGTAERFCGIRSAADLHKPDKNLSCGVWILAAVIRRDRVISASSGDEFLGLAKEWAVMRRHRDPFPKIKAATRAFCDAEDDSAK